MTHATLRNMIRDLLVTGDLESRQRNAAWLHSLIDSYVPATKEQPSSLAGVR